MKSQLSQKSQIASVVFGVFASLYAAIEGILFGFLIGFFVSIGEGLGGTVAWLSGGALIYLGLACIIMAVVALLGTIVTAKAPRAGSVILSLATVYNIAFGVIVSIYANGQAGAVIFALGGMLLHLVTTVLAFVAAKKRTVSAASGDSVNATATAPLEAGDTPIEVPPMSPTATIERGTIPFDATDSLGAINQGKGTATLPTDLPADDPSDHE